MGSNQQVQYSEFLEEKFKKPKSIKCGYILIVVEVLHGPSGAVVYLSASSLSLLGVLLVVGSIPDLPSLFWHCQVGKDKFRHRLASATCDESRLKSFTFDQSETFLTTSTCPFSLVLVRSRNIGFSLGLTSGLHENIQQAAWDVQPMLFIFEHRHDLSAYSQPSLRALVGTGVP